MARGITEKDVFTACDTLVLAGERPTIERVRQQIGRGSPNTVSPMLDAWFKGLGRRLQDPGAFAAPPDIPEPVSQAAQHFWEVAQAQARGDFDLAVASSLTPLQQQLDAAHQAAAILRAESEVRARDMDALRGQLADAASRVDAERMAHAATSALLESGQARQDELRGRVVAAEAAVVEAWEQARRESNTAQDRASGAERRAAMEIEEERQARSRADKRLDVLEKRAEALQATSNGQIEELVALRMSLDYERGEVARLRAANDEASKEREVLDAAMIETRLALGRAEAEAKSTQAAMTQLLPLVGSATAKKATARKRSSAP